MPKSALHNVRTLTAAVVALLVIPVSAQKPVNSSKAKGNAEKSGSATGIATTNYRSPGTLHKISVSDRQTINALISQGARMISDYGSYALLQANDALANTKGAQVVDENNLVLLNAGAIDTSTPEAQSKRTASSGTSGKGMRLIQFVGPIRPEWYQALVATGARIVTYIPSNSYLVYGTSDRLQAVQNLAANKSIVQWDGAYDASYRLDPAVTVATNSSENAPRPNLSEKGNEQFVIQLVEDPAENKVTLALIDKLKLEPIIKQENSLGYVNVKVALPAEAVSQIAERVDVVSIQQWITPKLLCERQDQIMAGNLTGGGPTPGDYLAYLTGKGYNLGTIANFGVNVSDSGLDNGTTTPYQFLLYRLGDSTLPADSRVSYVVLTGSGGTAADLQGCNGHGNLNCTIIGGYVPTGTVGGVNFAAFPHADASGFRWGLGIAPFVKVGLSVIFSTTGAYLNPTFSTLESNAYAAGMRISSNSWGQTTGTGVYNTDSQAYDALVRDAQSGTAGNQEYTIVFSAGNSGSGATTIGSPGTGKNVITVGAGEDVNPFGGADGSSIDDSGANNANDIIFFSSRGPCTDQRKKPDIMGPGTHVSGGAPQNAANAARTGNGTVLACFTGNGVSGGVDPNKFFPAGQQWYTASSGTSHSCPAVAGTAALYRQYFIDHALTPPSPALIKALLMNSARYMNGTGANDTLWSNNQGMGEANLNNFFDTLAGSHVIHDESAADLFTASGQVRTITGTVGNNAKPFRVTLAWTEPPGPTSGNAYINNLDLEVTVGGYTYKGNVFSGASSVTGGPADTRNNVESVFVPAGVSGNYLVKITATNIAGDGVPGNASALDQDFALIVNNGNEASAAVISNAGTTLSTETCSPGNGVIDPGEAVTVSVCLQNVGTANASNLVGTLQSSGGVTHPGGPQNYGALLAGGAQVCRNFTFTATGSCGGAITGTIHLQDGANDLGNLTFTFPLGVPLVTPPALPTGWTADQGVNAAGAPLWVTSNSGAPTPVADTAPNAAFTQDPGNTCDNRIYTPTFMYSSGAQLTFKQNYDLEQLSATTAYDGGVLEISINGGAYTDIITAGGSWVTGGYNHTDISTCCTNPLLPTRPNWSGVSGGFVTTTVNLPPSGVGQPVKLRWRMGSDNLVGHTGWRIDTVRVASGSVLSEDFEGTVCCTLAPSSVVSRMTHGSAGTFDVNFPLPPNSSPRGVECRSSASLGTGNYVIVFTFANQLTKVEGAGVTSHDPASGTGESGPPMVSGNTCTVNLSDVSNAQYITVTLLSATDATGASGDVVGPQMGVLVGDVNATRRTDSGDVTAVRNHTVSVPSDDATARFDVNASGRIDAGDVTSTRNATVTVLPP